VRHHLRRADRVEHRVGQLLTGAPDAFIETADPDLAARSLNVDRRISGRSAPA